VWRVIADLEHAAPRYEPSVARMHIIERHGQRLNSTPSKGSLFPVAQDEDVPDGDAGNCPVNCDLVEI
jgi:hypothetical protein